MAWPIDDELTDEKKKDLLAMMDIIIRQLMNVDDHLVSLLIVLSPIADEIKAMNDEKESVKERLVRTESYVVKPPEGG